MCPPLAALAAGVPPKASPFAAGHIKKVVIFRVVMASIF
jgi:hypothetical protein